MANICTAEIYWQRFASDGDMGCFRSLFETYHVRLCRYAEYFLKDSMDAEEVVLDLFLYLWRNREWLSIDISIDAYLLRSVRNRSLNILRSRHHDLSVEEILQASVPPDLSSIDTDDILRIVEDAVSSLPPKCREVFSKSRKEEMSNQEIAVDMGLSVKTVEAQMTKALKRLRLELKKSYLFMLF